MKVGAIIGDDALAVAEDFIPLSNSLFSHTGAGTRWVRPIRLDRHRTVIVRDTATKIRHQQYT